MNPEKVQLLAQLVQAMSEAESKLEHYYKKKDMENLNKAKKSILEFQQKIKEVLESGA